MLKTKHMRKILEPIAVQIKKLADVVNDDKSEEPDSITVKKVVYEQLDILAYKLEDITKEDVTNYQLLKQKIANIIEQFCLMNINTVISDEKCQLNINIPKKLMEKFLLSLSALEKLEIIPVKQNLEECNDYVREMGNISEIEDLQNIKELGASVLEVVDFLQSYRKNVISPLLSEKIALYICQLSTTFSLLVKVIQEQHQLNAPIYTCKKYVCDRMCLCLELITNTLDASNPTEEEESLEKENHFVYRMDLVLDIIAGIAGKTQKDQIAECKDLFLGIEDVFSHAMSIAQVCQPYNFEAINGSCQSIMTEYENLKTQLQSDPQDPQMNNLFMNSLTDSLYRLERKINVSVLTLVMEVFSDPFGALKRLIKMCGNALNAQKRSRIDLNSAIEEFDQLTDKAMQIGKFAIACCKNSDKVIKVRNCLASFESLEMELIPAIAAFYLHPDNKEMRANVKMLTSQWQLDMNKFHRTVDLIIDSVSYCQVILDDIQDRVTDMSNCLDNRKTVTQTQVQGVVQRAIALASQITATVDDIGSDKIDKQTIMMIREFKAAIYEADAASKKILVENATSSAQLRVINRCDLLLNVVKRLQPALLVVVNNSNMDSTYRSLGMGQGDSLFTYSRLSFPMNVYRLPRDQKSSTYIRTPYTVQRYKPPVSIQPRNSVPRAESDMSTLIPYIKRGRAMRVEWSVMYKTPKRDTEKPPDNRLKMRNLSSIRQHLFSKDTFMWNSTIDLSSESVELTNILEKITGLSDTLSTTVSSPAQKVVNSSDLLPKSKHKSPIPNHILQRSLNKLDGCSTIGGGDAPSPIKTIDRSGNIQELNKKMKLLMKS